METTPSLSSNLYLNMPFIIQTITKKDYDDMKEASKVLEDHGKNDAAAKLMFRHGNIYQVINGCNSILFANVEHNWNFNQSNTVIMIVVYEVRTA